jgi:DNA ligase-1
MITRFQKGVAVSDLTKIRLPCYASPKIDGFRCGLDHNQAYTSRLSLFPNLVFQKATTGLFRKPWFLDGEVVVGKRRGKGVLTRTSSGLTTKEGDPDWKLWLFDLWDKDEPFGNRYAQLQDIVEELGHKRIKLVHQVYITNYAQLVAYLEEQLALGFEGIMTRDPQGTYKQGKSTLREQYLLKVKPFEDFEFLIEGYYEEQKNNNEAKKDKTGKSKRSSSKANKIGKGTLGGFTGTELKTGAKVRVGGGFSAAQRQEFWDKRDAIVAAKTIGKAKKQVVGEKDRPRHPSWIDFRPGFDITD